MRSSCLDSSVSAVVIIENLRFNPLMPTVKLHSNLQLCSNTVIGTMAVDGWVVTSVQRGGDYAGPQPAQFPPRCTTCNSPRINGHCTNVLKFDVAL